MTSIFSPSSRYLSLSFILIRFFPNLIFDLQVDGGSGSVLSLVSIGGMYVCPWFLFFGHFVLMYGNLEEKCVLVCLEIVHYYI